MERDHAIVRKGICALLAEELTLDVICQADSGEEAVVKAAQLHPDLALMDISLPGISGNKGATRQIRKVSSNSQIIFLSQHDSIQTAKEALKSGGHGYVSKIDAALELLKAIRIVREGTRFVSQRIVNQGWDPEGFDDKSPRTPCWADKKKTTESTSDYQSPS